jgi:hypothetical protein
MNNFRAYTLVSVSTNAPLAHRAPVPPGRVSLGASTAGNYGLCDRRQRTRGGLTLCIQPNIDVVGAETKQVAELDGLGQVATSGMAVIDSLLGQAEMSGERSKREELLHVVQYLKAIT